jgi:uncharacterized repeat protein (TIGR01451 family)
MKRTALLLSGLILSLLSISQTPGVKWTRYIRTSNDGETFYDMKGTPDHGFIAVGADSSTSSLYQRHWMANKYTSGIGWIAKLDTSGNMTWRNDNRSAAYFRSAYTSVVLSGDGGYVVAGYNGTSFDSSQFYIAKYNASGAQVWQKMYGGPAKEFAYSICKTSSGGYMVAGTTESTSGYVVGNHGPTNVADAWLIKLDGNGDSLWTRCFGGSLSDTAYSIIETADKNFVVAGTSRSSDGNLTGNNGAVDGWVFKIDTLGNLLWQQNFGGVGDDGFHAIIANADSSYTATGYSFSPTATSNGNKGAADVWVARINSNGSGTLWSKGFGGPAPEMGLSIIRTQDDGSFVTGYTESNANDVTGNSGLADAWVIKVTGEGNLTWQRCVGTAKDEFGLTAVYQSESQLTIAGTAQPVSTVEPGDGYVARLGNSNIIKGLLYLDLNSNGIKDAGEQPFDQASVVTFKSGFGRSSIPVNGIFQVEVETGTYTTQPSVSSFPYYTVVPTSRNSTFPTYFNKDSFSFAIRPIANKQDLNIQAVATTVARPGFIVNYRINYKNAGTVVVPNVTVLFKKDSRLTFQSAVPALNSSNGDTLKWNFSSLQPQASGVITLNLLVAPTVGLFTKLSSLAIIDPVAGDLTPRDDTAKLRQVAQGSYDPNDKAENLGGDITTQQVSSAEYINYIIRFQNTGTDTAFTVVVRDTISAKLNLGSLQVIESSHPYQYQGGSPNWVSWTFPDINLPDSNRNEPASHGFITYRIKPVTTLIEGDTILNNAGIYFDYNLPEITNEAVTVVQNLVTLPTRLITFSATWQQPNALLEWKTVEEQNVKEYEIQRSIDPVHFTTIGSVKAKGNYAGGTDYNFKDDLANLAKDKFYYRLRIMDIDEKYTYSRIVMINRNGQSKNEVILNPNPIRGGKAIAWIQFGKDATADIRIIDMQGRSVYTSQQRISKGYNVVPINFSTLKNGTYFLRVKAEGKQMVTPFVISQ